MTYNIDPMVCEHDGRIGMSIPPVCLQCGSRLQENMQSPYIAIDLPTLEERVAKLEFVREELVKTVRNLEYQLELLDDRDSTGRLDMRAE